MRMHVILGCEWCSNDDEAAAKKTNRNWESTSFQYLIEQLKYTHSPFLQWNAWSKNTDLDSNIWQLWTSTIFLLCLSEKLYG